MRIEEQRLTQRPQRDTREKSLRKRLWGILGQEEFAWRSLDRPPNGSVEGLGVLGCSARKADRLFYRLAKDQIVNADRAVHGIWKIQKRILPSEQSMAACSMRNSVKLIRPFCVPALSLFPVLDCHTARRVGSSRHLGPILDA